MGRCVVAFNALTGRDLEEAEGWLFQQLLKDARQWSGGKSQEKTRRYHRDSAEDCIAYAALKAEALEHERTSTDDTLPMEVALETALSVLEQIARLFISSHSNPAMRRKRTASFALAMSIRPNMLSSVTPWFLSDRNDSASDANLAKQPEFLLMRIYVCND